VNTIALYCENLAAFPAARAKDLDLRVKAEGLAPIEAVYALVWPDYPPELPQRPRDNREAFADWRAESGLPVWAWLNATPDQADDAVAIASLDHLLSPDGWWLDIEGPWVQGAKLARLLEAASATGRPRGATLAGASPSHVETDFRELERQGFAVEWQAYFNSRGGNGKPEGPRPDLAVSELYRASFVVESWEYRHRLGAVYGWGKVDEVTADELAEFDSYLRPRAPNAVFGVLPREFGWIVDDGILWPEQPSKPPVGVLMGRAPYAAIRVALNVTRPPVDVLTGEHVGWERAAASARVRRARKRPVSVFLAENATDEVILEIARGAA
jgi:hypothetical protein